MNKKIHVFLAFIILDILLSGCGSRNTVYLETIQTEEAETTATEITETSASEEVPADGLCYVYVCGAVNAPGVYALPMGSRVYEAVEKAGGMTLEASEDSLNQAEFVTDGQMLKILTWEEALTATDTSAESDMIDDGLLNINTASAADFMTLPGVGQSKAESIVKYREKCGGFSSIEEIMNVDGIKQGVFDKIKDSIKVN